MTTYLTPTGEDILICDTCGVAEDGSHPDVSGLQPVDLEDGLHLFLQAGGSYGAAMKGKCTRVQDFCPECGPKQEGARLQC